MKNLEKNIGLFTHDEKKIQQISDPKNLIYKLAIIVNK